MVTINENELAKRVSEIREKVAGNTYNEILEVYLEGYADGYNAALGKPPTKEGSTADLKELEKEAEVND